MIDWGLFLTVLGVGLVGVWILSPPSRAHEYPEGRSVEQSAAKDTDDCPCCGQPVPRDQLLVDLGSNSIQYRGKLVAVDPKQAELAHALAKAFPKVLRKHEAFIALWGGLDDKDRNDSLAVHVSLLRRALKLVGVSIVRGPEGTLRLSFAVRP